MSTDEHTFNFLLSSERSGSNLLCKILDAHPKISSPSPLHALRFFLPYLNEGCTFSEEDFSAFFKYKLGLWNTTSDANPSSDKQLGFWEQWESVYQKEAVFEDKSISFIKENRFHEIADPVLERYPNSKFIYLVRNPYSYVASFLKSPNHHGDIEYALSVWMEDQLQFLELEKQLGQRCLRVTYESLLTETEKTLKKISAHFGLNYSDKMLDFHLKPINLENAQRISNWENIAKPLINLPKTIQVPLSESSFNYISNVASGLLKTLFNPNLSVVFDGKEVAQRHLSTDETKIREQRSWVIEEIKNGLKVRKH